jgi:hypothetical protein
MINEIYENALLSAAAYARWDRDEAVIKSELLDNRGFTEDQYNTLFEISNPNRMFDIYGGSANGYYEDPVSGFSATIFQNRTTGKLTVAYRGTQTTGIDAGLDLYQDFWLAFGLGTVGGGQNNDAVAFLQNAGLIDAFGQINETYRNAVTFTGHSLGGYLALVAAYSQPDLLDNTYSYNGAGIKGLDQFYLETVLPWLNDHANDLVNASNTTHIYADKGFELTADYALWFDRPGSYQPVFIENDSTFSFENHSIERMVESLSMYRVLNLLDSTADTNSIYKLLDAAASVPLISLETVVNQLGDMLGGNLALATNKNDIELFYQEVNTLVNTAQSQTDIIFLANSSAQSIAAMASLNTDEGRAYRYALVNATSFTLLTNITGAAINSSDYDLANFTEQYLQDRAQYLSTLLSINTKDFQLQETLSIAGDLDITIDNNGQSFAEVTPRVNLNQNLFFTAAAAEQTIATGTQRTYTIFDNDAGNEELNGKDQNDHIYGAGGNDTLTGGKGNDYLEGGSGHDTYRFNYGDGRDVIVDNGMAADENQLVIAHTEGGTPSAVVSLELIAGTNTYKELDASGNVINSSTTYQRVSGAVAGQFNLLISIDGGKGGSITHQFDNGFAQWSSAFLCMSKETNQRKHIPQSSPLGALVFDKNKRSALCHIPVAKRLKSTSCCLNPLFVSTLGLMKGKQAA